MKKKDSRFKYNYWKNWFLIRGGDLKKHIPTYYKKYLQRKTKPKAEFYEKRGR